MQPIDWDDALDNRSYTKGWEEYPPRFAAAAEAFREARMAAGEAMLGLAYGDRPRERLDLFRPHGEAKGLVVIVHGGYWRSFDRTDFSHLAAGPLGEGWAVALPGYTLCPEGSVPGIGREVARAVEHAAGLVRGPIRLAGHSAGGQVVTRLVAERSPLQPRLMERIEAVLSISGVHDLLPLLSAGLNDDLRLDEAAARAESPARLKKAASIPVTAWVGAEERPEFLRQSALLREAWDAAFVVEPGRHHFDVIVGLERPGPMLERLLGPA